MREFGRGAALLGRGFGWWRRDPGVMALGLLPGLLVAVVFAGALVALAAAVGPITAAMTPFADGWPEVGRLALRVLVGTALLGGAGVLAVVSFTAVALVVGEPCYDRVWRAVERRSAGSVPDAGYGLGAATVDAVSLVVRGLGVALLAALLGLIPVVGGVAAAVVGFALTAWLVADELASRALSARGLDRRTRRALLRAHRARVLGFGAATQLCFLVPLGAVAVMPAAVAGSTLLAQSLLAAGPPAAGPPAAGPPAAGPPAASGGRHPSLPAGADGAVAGS